MSILRLILWLPALLTSLTIAASPQPVSSTGFPDEVFPLIEQTRNRFDEAGMVTIFDRIETDYSDSGAAVTEEEILIHFRDEAEATAYRSLHYEYNPRTAFIEFLAVFIYRADGKTVDEIPLTNVSVHKAPADSIFWNFDIVLCPIPLLNDGDALYYKIRRQGLNLAYLDEESPEGNFRFVPPQAGFFMDTLFFQEKHPLIEKTYSINGPRSKPLQFSTANGSLDVSVRFSEESWHYRFSVRDMDAWVEEQFDDGYEETALKLALASHPSWEMKSKWAYEHNEPQFIISDALQSKALEIVKGCEDDACKMFQLLHWVAEEIRYLGLDMGEGEGHMVHPTDEIFDDRAGVCKDKAAILVSMLRAVGFESYFVMTLAMERTIDIPADDKFNHGVVAVRNPDDTWTFLDPTWAPQNRPLFNYLEQEQPVLIAAPEGQPLRHIPYSPPEESPLKIQAETSLNADGSAVIDMLITTDGFVDGEFRRNLSWMDPWTRDVFFRSFIEQLSIQANLLSYTFSNPVNFDEPITMHLRAEIPNAAVTIDKDLYLNPLLTRHPWNRRWESDYLHISSDDPPVSGEPELRKHGLELDCTRLIEFQEIIRFPKGYQIMDLPDPVEIKGKTIDGTFRIVAERKNSVRIDQVIRIKRRVTPPEDCPELLEGVESLQKIRKTRLVLKTDGDTIRNPSPPPSRSAIPIAPKNLPEFGARINKRETSIMFEKERLIERFHSEVTVLNSAGRDEFSDNTFVAKKGDQIIRCVENYIVTPDGKRIDAPATAVNTTLAAEAASAPDYANVMNTMISHVGIETGSRLFSTVERETVLSPGLIGRIPEFLFMPVSDFPSDIVRFSISVSENDDVRFEAFNTSITPEITVSDSGQKTYVWTFSDLKPAPFERHSGGYFRNEPFIIAVPSTMGGWDQRIEALRTVMFSTEPVPEGVRLKTDSIISDLNSVDEKTDALLEYVGSIINDIDLSPIRFMMETRPPERTLSSGYGHSLDRLVLLAAMVESAGGKCEIGLGGPRWSVSRSIPGIRSLSDYYARITFGDRWRIASLDSPHISAGKLIDQSIVWIGREGSEWFSPHSTDDQERDVSMVCSVDIKEDMTLSGMIELNWSGYWNPGPEASRETLNWVRRCLPEWIEKPEIMNLDVSTLEKMTGSTGFTIKFKGTTKLSEFSDEIQGIVLKGCPFGLLREPYILQKSPHRRYPFTITRCGREHDRIIIRYPETWKVLLTPETKSFSAPFGSFKQSIDQSANKIVFERSLELTEQRIPPDQFDDFIPFWNDLTVEDENRILFQTGSK